MRNFLPKAFCDHKHNSNSESQQKEANICPQTNPNQTILFMKLGVDAQVMIDLPFLLQDSLVVVSPDLGHPIDHL